MERIIVTLLLVVVSVAALIGMSTWSNNNKNTAKTSATSIMTNVISDAQN